MKLTQTKLFDTSKSKEDKIIDLVCKRFGIPYCKLINHSNKPEYSNPRRMCWWLLKTHMGYSQERIAGIFAGRNRSTIAHGIIYIDGLNIKFHEDLYTHKMALDFNCKLLK